MAQYYQNQASNLQDEMLLDELFHGDLGFDEMIPVDTFFDSYVNQLQKAGPSAVLSSKNVQQVPNQSNAYDDTVMHGMQTYQATTNTNSGESGPFLNSSNPAFVGQPGFAPVSNLTGYSEQGVQNQMLSQDRIIQNNYSQRTQQQIVDFQGGVPQQTSPPLSTGQVQSYYQQMLAGRAVEGEILHGTLDGSVRPNDFSDEDENSNDKNDSRPRRVRNRTPKQQALNKQAQQRYRERKKNKAITLEKTVEALTLEVQDLRQVREQKTRLEDKASELEQKLLEREAELNRLKAEIHNQLKGAGSGNSVNIGGSGGDASSRANSDRYNGDQFDLNKEAMLLADRFHSNVDDIRQILKLAGIDNSRSSDIYGKSVDAEVNKKLKELVMEVCMVCMRALRMEGVDIWSMISASLKTSPSQTKKWNSEVTASRLGFTDEQKRRALELRKEYLRRLQDIFNERQGLNLQAISVLLPSEQGGQGPNLQKTGLTQVMGFFSRVKHNSRMNQILEQLRENLRAEQRAASELDYIVFQKLFTPIQGAWFVLECYPEHCDCLDLLNGCEQAFGQKFVIS
eukprot:TRINITY_DN5480_c0_g1_i10.p1 TRINITY_DN5480_c0_g1~~TRINITY_DN5480_c0_g1_i10.p1  ORF type:complete len:567 (-),score=61.17 TRINITY_DN5480_c0_g1_i10:1878-3578(-)